MEMELSLNGEQIGLLAALVARIARDETHDLKSTVDKFELTRDTLAIATTIFPTEDLEAFEIKDLGKYGEKRRTAIFTFVTAPRLFIDCGPQPEFKPEGDIGPNGPQGGGAGYTEPTRLAA